MQGSGEIQSFGLLCRLKRGMIFVRCVTIVWGRPTCIAEIIFCFLFDHSPEEWAELPSASYDIVKLEMAAMSSGERAGTAVEYKAAEVAEEAYARDVAAAPAAEDDDKEVQEEEDVDVSRVKGGGTFFGTSTTAFWVAEVGARAGDGAKGSRRGRSSCATDGAAAADDDDDDGNKDDDGVDLVDVREEGISCRAKQSDFSVSFRSRSNWHRAAASVIMAMSRDRATAAADVGERNGTVAGISRSSAAYCFKSSLLSAWLLLLPPEEDARTIGSAFMARAKMIAM
jgi:hypothetical protein